MNKEEIGKNLLVLRGNMSREIVAKTNGISVSALQMYEKWQRIPRDEIKVSLARYYGKSIEEIFLQMKYTYRVLIYRFSNLNKSIEKPHNPTITT